MPVQQGQNVPDEKQNSKSAPAVANTTAAQSAGDDAVGSRGGKEKDAIYNEEAKLLDEVKEKYKEADLEAQKQVEHAIGEETKNRTEVKIAAQVRDAGLVSHEEEASNVVKHGGALELAVSEEKYKQGKKTGIGGKRLINKNIVGVSSLAAMAVFIGRLLKVAHKHAKRVIFRNRDQEVITKES